MKAFAAVVFCALMSLSMAAQAQGVYVTRGENGPVFSDKPQPGAKEVTLRPLNVIAPPPDSKTPAPPAEVTPSDNKKPEAAAVAYRSFSVVSPENNGSVVANSATIEVRVAVDPPLQLGEGHAFSVSLNGQPVGQRFTATEFTIPPEFWGDTLPPPNQSVQLDANIVDLNGTVLKKAAPVRFIMRYVTVLNHPRRIIPPQNVRPKLPPKPKPEPESTFGRAIKRTE